VFSPDQPNDSAAGDVAVTAAVVSHISSDAPDVVFVQLGEIVSPGSGHTAVPPTVMKHLGLSIDPAWGYEGDPFGP
jgi:hypothetical protein